MFSNFKSKLQVATHSMKEKMGKTEATVETEDTRVMKQNFKTIKHGYKNINHSGKSYLSESEKLSLITNELGDSLLFLSTGAFSTSSLGFALQTLGNQLKSISSVSQSYVSATNTNFVSPVAKILDVDIKRANDLYKRQESARIKYDLALAQVRKGSSGRAAEELEMTRQTYEQLTRELTEVLNSVLAQIGTELIYELKNWTDSQARYYTEMSKMWSQMTSELESVPGTSQLSTTSSVINAYVPLTPTTQTYISDVQSTYTPTSYNTTQPTYTTNTTQVNAYNTAPTLITQPEVITSTTTVNPTPHPYNQQGTISLEKSFPPQTVANEESPFALNEPTYSKPRAANPFA
eukprot:TRINITY_DN410_c0_g1_i7.p1 TRINITY_DN410_c0_g1~~TRINITY_DN410_c0_g1_i7.p1  ORF type:complete len:349 (-),score=93.63 TRINITY_DN410_c0_g1_i7:173-1219(-)